MGKMYMVDFDSGRTKSREGFTLVELSFSIVFISILSIAVALVVSNAIASYHKGVILNQVNTVGMELVDDMRSAIQNSQARSLVSECSNAYADSEAAETRCIDDSAQNFVSVARKAEVKRGGNTIGSVPVFGAFCTGAYSYIWNSGYFFGDEYTVGNSGLAKASLKYRDRNGVVQDRIDFKLLKVKDEGRAVCVSASGSDYTIDVSGINNTFDITGGNYNMVEEDPVEMLSGDYSLAIYDLSAAALAENRVANNALYSVSFILATVQGGININAKGDYCVTPGDYANAMIESFDYCAINKFNFAAQAIGG